MNVLRPLQQAESDWLKWWNAQRSYNFEQTGNRKWLEPNGIEAEIIGEYLHLFRLGKSNVAAFEEMY